MHFIHHERSDPEKRAKREKAREARASEAAAAAERRERQDRLEREQGLMVERSGKAASFLRLQGNCAIVAEARADTRYFSQGLEMSSLITGKVQWYQASGNVQGQPKKDADIEAAKFSQLVSEIRREDGFSVIGFLGVSFEADAGAGNPDVVQRLRDITDQQKELPQRERYLGVIGIGRGIATELPTIKPMECGSQSPFLDLMDVHYVLDESGELSIPVGPQPDRDYRIGRRQADDSSRPSRGITEFGGTRLP